MSTKINRFSVVVCVDSEYGFSEKDKIPWENPYYSNEKYNSNKDLFINKIVAEHLDFIKAKTQNSVVIMGAKTAEIIYKQNEKLLDGRINIVVSDAKRSHSNYVGAIYVNTFEEAIQTWNNRYPHIFNKECYVIGGDSVFKHAVIHPACGNIYINQIPAFVCKVEYDYEDYQAILKRKGSLPDIIRFKDINRKYNCDKIFTFDKNRFKLYTQEINPETKFCKEIWTPEDEIRAEYKKIREFRKAMNSK
jgi:dihydrofolate reductase